MSYSISEIFESIQGEGTYAGTPALFIRFAYCNLDCTFCDTDFSMRYRLTLTELIDTIRESKMQHVILTGGEPTLQAIDAIINAVSEKLFQVESNGRQVIEDVSENMFLTVSPKENFSMKAIHQADEIKLLMDENANETLRKISAYMHKIRFASLWDDAESLSRALSAAIEHQRPLSIQTHKYLGVA